MDLKTIVSEVDLWPPEDRLQLMDAIWAGLLRQGHEPELTPEQLTELDRRIADDDAHPDDVIPWEQVKAAALKRARR